MTRLTRIRALELVALDRLDTEPTCPQTLAAIERLSAAEDLILLGADGLGIDELVASACLHLWGAL